MGVVAATIFTLLDNKYALLFIRGERPVMDSKYDILKHPNVKLTTDGKGENFVHGFVDQSVLEFKLDTDIDDIDIKEVNDANVAIYSKEEIEEYLLKLQEDSKNEKE